MHKHFSRILPATLALATAIAIAPSANAAAVRGEASAVIHPGISMRTASGSAAPVVELAGVDLPPARTVFRQCRPNDAGSPQCRLVLIELQ